MKKKLLFLGILVLVGSIVVGRLGASDSNKALRIGPFNIGLESFFPYQPSDQFEEYKTKVIISRDSWGIPRKYLCLIGCYCLRTYLLRFIKDVHGERDCDAAFGFAFAQAEDDFNTIQQRKEQRLSCK